MSQVMSVLLMFALLRCWHFENGNTNNPFPIVIEALGFMGAMWAFLYGAFIK